MKCGSARPVAIFRSASTKRLRPTNGPILSDTEHAAEAK